jgi:hypothetical protein
MGVFELARFTIDPADAEEMLATRDAMVAAIRRAFAGLREARLARIDDETWIDVWRWESATSAKAAAEGAPSIPEAAAMFALIKDVVAMEHAEILHEG